MPAATLPSRRGIRSRFRDLGLRTRLGFAFGGIGLLVVGCAAGGVAAVGQQRDLAQQINAVDGVIQDAETMRFQIADATGWQGFVMADVAAFGAPAALADDSYNRAGFLDSKQAVYDWLDDLDTSAMSADEKAAGREAAPGLGQLLPWDDQVVAWVRPGTQAGLATAMTSINGGDAGAAYGIVLGIADTIADSAKARLAGLHDEQPASQHRATALLWSGGALALLLAALLAWTMTRSLVRPLSRIREVRRGRGRARPHREHRADQRRRGRAHRCRAGRRGRRGAGRSSHAARHVGGRGGGVVGGAVGVLGADLGVGGGDLARSPAWCPPPRRRCPATWRPWPRVPSRWVPRSGRSPRTRRGQPRSPPRR